MDDMNSAATAPSVSDWRPLVSDDMKADPVVSAFMEKATEKDVSSLVKGLAHAQKRMGSAINLPGKDAKPEDLAALRTKLYETGVFAAPPSKPEEYGLADPGNLPEGVKFSPELASKFAAAMYKHGIPKAALEDLMPVYLEAIQGRSATLKTDADARVAELRKEHGEKFDERWELADRLAKDIFKTPEEIDYLAKTGAGPLLYGPLLRLAHLAGQDSAYIESLKPSGDGTANAASEHAKIMTDSKHPMHEAYKRSDPKVLEYIDGLYRKQVMA